MLKSMHALNSQKKRENTSEIQCGFWKHVALVLDLGRCCYIETWIFIRFGK